MGHRDRDLRQCDLSHLRVQEMTPERCAELKRRYHRFVRHFGSAGIELERQPRREKRRLRQWVKSARA